LVLRKRAGGPFHILDNVIEDAGFQLVLVLGTGLGVAATEAGEEDKDEREVAEHGCGEAQPQRAW
jgi:hypothetical protein